MFDDGAGNANGVTLLERVHANGVGRHLPADDHHRNAVHVSRGDAGYGIGHTRPRGHQGNAHIARGAGIAVSRMHRRLFMTDQHVLNRVLLVEGVVNVQHSAAGVTPDVLDLFGLQCLDQNLRAAELHCCTRFLRGSCRRSDFSFRYFHDEPL